MRLGFAGTPVLPAAYQPDDPSRLVLIWTERAYNASMSTILNG
jgi:hypothetical protein